MHSKSGELSPLKPCSMESGHHTFHATWPSITDSTLLPTHICRRLISLYATSFLPLLLISSLLGSKTSHETTINIMAFISGLLMTAITVLEFDTCGIRSFLFSSTWMGVFLLIAVAVSRDSVVLLLVFTPGVYLLPRTLVSFIASCFILPAQITYNGLQGRVSSWQSHDAETLHQFKHELVTLLNGESVALTTADGVAVDAMFFPSRKMHAELSAANESEDAMSPRVSHTQPSSLLFRRRRYQNLEDPAAPSSPHAVVALPVIVFVNGNNEAFEFKGEEIQLYLSQGYSVLVFNYRGVSGSGGRGSRDGLVLDLDACYQFLHKGLGVEPWMICFLGSSLGGAVSTEVAALHPGCGLCNDRSFSSLVLEAELVAGSMFHVSRDSKRGWVFCMLVSALVAFGGWEYDVARRWQQVKGNKFLLYHNEDSIIPHGARLHTRLAQLRVRCAEIELKPSLLEEAMADVEERGLLAHGRPLTDLEFAEQLRLLNLGFSRSST